MTYFDTHCHIHSDDYGLDADQELHNAIKAGVGSLIVVGTTTEDSKKAIKFAKNNKKVWASVGVHPHDSKDDDASELEQIIDENVVAIGECGLDYWYMHSEKTIQENVLRTHIGLAVRKKLPLIIHLRGSKDNEIDAYHDFERIIADYSDISGVIHSFTLGVRQLGIARKNGLYVGVNGIVTFSKSEQQEVVKSIPLDMLLLETDSPYLTPVPHRGKINTPSNVVLVGEHIAKIKGLAPEDVATATSANASTLFGV